jgi:hypothetical protein
MVYLTDSLIYQEPPTYEVIYARYDWIHGILEKTVISDFLDLDDAFHPSIASLSPQSYPPHLNIVYFDDDDWDDDILCQRSNDEGSNWLGRFEIYDNEDLGDYDPSNVAGLHWHSESIYVHYVWTHESPTRRLQEETGVISYKRFSYPKEGGPPNGNGSANFGNLIGDWEEECAESPSVAVSDRNVYVVATDAEPDEYIPNIYFRRNIYYGELDRWQEIQLISEDMPPNSYAIHPSITAYGSNIYVVWEQYICVQQTPSMIYVPVVYFRRSTDWGVSWDSPVQIRGPGAPGPNGRNVIPVYEFGYTPSLHTSDPNIFIVWQWGWGPVSGPPYGYNLALAWSSDRGETWPKNQTKNIGGYWPKGPNPKMNPSIFVELDAHIVWTEWDTTEIIQDPEIYYKRIPLEYLQDSRGGGQDKIVQNSTTSFLKIEPNPCTKFTKIAFQLSNSNTTLKIYDVTGKLVNSIWQGDGKGEVIWNRIDVNNKKVNAGTYFLRLESGNYSKIAKLIVR